MNRISLALLVVVATVLAAAGPLFSQDPAKEVKPAPADTADNEGDPSDSGDDASEESEEEVVGIPADYNEYLKKRYPGLDPGGRHDIFNLKNPTGKDERHEYTVAMAQLILAYMTPQIGFGSTLSKLFDQYSRGKEANSPVFKTLYSIVLLYYPPGDPNTAAVQQLLREAAELAPDYAYPHFMLAQFEFARLTQVDGVSPRATLQAIDKTLTVHPDFLRAILLKCEVLFMYKQPERDKEVYKIISPWLNEKLPGMGDDFEDVLLVYARCPGADLLKRIDEYVASGKLTTKQKLVAHELAGRQHFGAERFDEAIEHFQKMTDLSEAEAAPDRILAARKFLAACWDFKARNLKDKTAADPKIKQQYDSFVQKALELHRSCAELEATELPVAFRGEQALQYADFLAYMLDRKQEAVDWLTTYLAATDLARTRRYQLENKLATLKALLDPSEENLIAMYRGSLQRGDMERLAISLGTAKERIRIQGEHFKEDGSLAFFLQVLDTGNRLVDGYAAFLAADTAKQLGGESVTKAGEALLQRLEKENELKSEAQANLHTSLAEALKLLGSWPHMEKAVLHSAKMVKAAKNELNVRALTQPIIDNWNDEALLNKLTPPIKRARRMDVIDPESASEWMTKKLAEGIRKTAEAAAKEEAEKKAEEKDPEAG